jgi:hypothetical protein
MDWAKVINHTMSVKRPDLVSLKLLQIQPLKILDIANLKWCGPRGQVIPYVFFELVVC